MNYWQMIKFGYLPVSFTDLSHNMKYSVSEPFEISYSISISFNDFNIVINTFCIIICIRKKVAIRVSL